MNAREVLSLAADLIEEGAARDRESARLDYQRLRLLEAADALRPKIDAARAAEHQEREAGKGFF